MSRTRALERAAIPVMLGAGALAAVRTTVDGRLAHELGTGRLAGLLAAVVSFGSGLAVLVAVCAATPALRRGVGQIRGALREGRLRPWHGLGGAAGAALVGVGIGGWASRYAPGPTASSRVRSKETRP